MATRAGLSAAEAAEIEGYLQDLRRPQPPDWMTGDDHMASPTADPTAWSTPMMAVPSQPSIPDVDGFRRGGRVRVVGRLKHPGRMWAYGGALLSGALSIAGNVASVAMPPPDAAAGWEPSGWKLGFAAIIPVLVIVGFEIWHRVDWPRKYWFARWVAMVAVIAAPAVVSFQHMYDLMTRLGESHTVAVLVPVAIDGLMVMAVLALKAQAEADRAAGRSLGYRPA